MLATCFCLQSARVSSACGGTRSYIKEIHIFLPCITTDVFVLPSCIQIISFPNPLAVLRGAICVCLMGSNSYVFFPSKYSLMLETFWYHDQYLVLLRNIASLDSSGILLCFLGALSWSHQCSIYMWEAFPLCPAHGQPCKKLLWTLPPTLYYCPLTYT